MDIIPLARCRYGSAKDQERDEATWIKEMAAFPLAVRSNAANLAAHSHDITLVGDRLLVSASWHNYTKFPGTGWFTKDGNWTAITDDEWDALYPEVEFGGTNQSGKNRSHTIQTDWLLK